MGSPFNSPDFKRLLAEWNQRLADSGFRDIEKVKNGQRVLKKSGSEVRFERCNQTLREARENYYDLVRFNIQVTVFEDEIDREILVLFSEGIKQTEIKQRLDVSLHRSTIYKRLNRWLKRWGLK